MATLTLSLQQIQAHLGSSFASRTRIIRRRALVVEGPRGWMPASGGVPSVHVNTALPDVKGPR